MNASGGQGPYGTSPQSRPCRRSLPFDFLDDFLRLGGGDSSSSSSKKSSDWLSSSKSSSSSTNPVSTLRPMTGCECTCHMCMHMYMCGARAHVWNTRGVVAAELTAAAIASHCQQTNQSTCNQDCHTPKATQVGRHFGPFGGVRACCKARTGTRSRDSFDVDLRALPNRRIGPSLRSLCCSWRCVHPFFHVGC